MILEDIHQLIASAASDLGYLIYESSVLLKGENSKLVVRIDRETGGISHQDCERFSRELADRMDKVRLVPNYTLEVSSPGLKRKIRSLGEFQRFTGEPVKVQVAVGEGKEVYKGKIDRIEGEVVYLTGENGERALPYNTIVQANLDY